MKPIFEKIIKTIETDQQEMIDIRRHLHRNPESSLQEFQTASYIRRKLSAYNIDYIEVGDTGTLATIVGKKGPGKRIFLRADIDALEMDDYKQTDYASQIKGMSHACGHDGHTTSLLEAAKVLKAVEEEFSGTVLLAFQQAEEIGAGAKQFIEAGHLKHVDAVFGIHLASDLAVGQIEIDPGPINAACDNFTIEIFGEGSHASKPQLGRDAAVATASVVTALQSIVSRSIDPSATVVLSLGRIAAGTRRNVVASHGIIEGTLRTYDKELRLDLLEEIPRIAKLAAGVHHCTVSFENDNAAPALINDPGFAEFAQGVVRETFGAQHLAPKGIPSLGAEDFAEYLLVAKGAFARVGSRNAFDPNTALPHHHGCFDIDEGALLLSAKLHVAIALAFLDQ